MLDIGSVRVFDVNNENSYVVNWDNEDDEVVLFPRQEPYCD